jgi:tRNA(Arg) A34 adenosine deaminase TadA
MIANSRHNKIIQTLGKVAEDVLPVGRVKISAAIVIKNEIISIGTNKMKSHPLQAKFGRNYQAIYIHAEIDAIAKALRRLDARRLTSATLYVARIKVDNTGKAMWGLARPCSGCAGAIESFGIKQVIWTDDGYCDDPLELGVI